MKKIMNIDESLYLTARQITQKNGTEYHDALFYIDKPLIYIRENEKEFVLNVTKLASINRQ